MLNTAIERKFSVNYILYLELFLQKIFLVTTSVNTQSFNRKPWVVCNLQTASFLVSLWLSLCISLCLLLSVSCALLIFQWGVQVPPYHRLCTWWKLVKETKIPAGVRCGPDIVLALGWGAACQGPLYEGCPPWKTYLFIPMCGPASDPGPCCSLCTRDLGCCC